MVAYIILGIALFAGFLLLLKWFTEAEPKQILRVGAWVLGGLAVGLALFFLYYGRYFLIGFVLPMLIPILARFMHMRQRVKAAQGGTRGQTSEVRTRFFLMALDHDSGRMDGEVLEGLFLGRALSSLDLEDLIRIWREVDDADDDESLRVLEAYLDRTHGPDWREALEAGERKRSADREQESARAQSSAGPMTDEEAYEILGLSPGASAEEIKEAHRRLMQQLHPDHGGSDYLASKINQAREHLLNKR